jgi:MoaA/NifB/PqqE/SkfB family radical SAM enzyme
MDAGRYIPRANAQCGARAGGARFANRRRAGDRSAVSASAPSALSSPRAADPVYRHYAALDIVDNCNLRCPFCLFDYGRTKSTHFMSEPVFEAALRLLPLLPAGGFWLSCLHEPSLHPGFLALLARVPPAYRDRLMFTTNIAKRADAAYFRALAESGVFFINISIESRTASLYEKFRKGARFAIFEQNWERLIAAWREAAAPPRLRYIIMAYRSNLAEIPSLVRYLRAERLAWQVEIRHTYEQTHIDPEFRATEFLEMADWAWLGEALGDYPADEVMVIKPDVAPIDVGHVVNAGDLLPAPREVPARLTPLPAIPPWRSAPNADAGARLPVCLQMRWDGQTVLLPPFLGYVDEIGKDFVLGWMRDERDAQGRSDFEVVLRGAAGPVLLGEGRADLDYLPLHRAGFGATNFGFRFAFDRVLSAAEREAVEIWPRGAVLPLPRAPRFEGFVNARSATRVEGWVRDRFDPQARVAFEVFIALPGRVERLGEGIADLFSERQRRAGRGEAHYAFSFSFSRALTPEERDRVVVRVIGESDILPIAGKLKTD